MYDEFSLVFSSDFRLHFDKINPLQLPGQYLPPSGPGRKPEENDLSEVNADQPVASQPSLKFVNCGCRTGCGITCG